MPHPVAQALSSVESEEGSPMQHHLTDQPKGDETIAKAIVCNCHTIQGILAELAYPIWAVTYMRQAGGDGQLWPLGKA